MKFGPAITKQIADELVKVPNVRAVCAKIGIDHSTFYRWMASHHRFFKVVTGAIEMGRDRMNDAAEGVVIRGIQENNFKAATYWLSHNNPRYANIAQHDKLYHINENKIELLREVTPEDPRDAAFESLFEMCEGAYKIFDPDHAKMHIDKFVKVVCHGDDQLEQIFYAAYEEWKLDRDAYLAKDKKAFPDENP